MTPTREESMQMAMKHCVLDCYEGDLTCIESLVAAAYALGAAQAQQTTAELPEAVAWMFQHDETGRVTFIQKAEGFERYDFSAQNPRWNYVDGVYTAAQMQAHYAAGVRAGAAQQAIQRGIDKILADPVKHGLDLGEQQ